MKEAILTAKESPKIDFEENCFYQIKNADPRFKDQVYLYVNTDNTLRWGVMQDNIINNYYWTIQKRGKNILLKNQGTGLYAGSSAWDASRPENVIAIEQEQEYQVDNSLQSDVPYE